jgi:hypothetical protein
MLPLKANIQHEQLNLKECPLINSPSPLLQHRSPAQSHCAPLFPRLPRVTVLCAHRPHRIFMEGGRLQWGIPTVRVRLQQLTPTVRVRLQHLTPMVRVRRQWGIRTVRVRRLQREGRDLKPPVRAHRWADAQLRRR